jgi:hypothetical protein
MTRLHATGLVLVGLLIGALLSVPSSAATGSGGTTAAPAAAAARLSPQRFLLLQTNPNQHRPMVAAFGAIHDHGRDIVLGPHRDRFKLQHGSVWIYHQARRGSTHDRFDPTTCYFSFTERGRWHVIRASGAYVGAHGFGHYRVHGDGFNCNENTPPEVFQLRIRAVGRIGA